MNILLANPRGFCAGVDRAISIVERALELFSPPIYVRHEVVHNRYVVQNLKDRGAIFVEELDQVPDNSIVIFSAHGVSQAVRAEAKKRGLKVFDATCPLVTKVHLQVTRASRKGVECILIGHEGHPEVEGTMGQYDNPEGGVYLIESVEDVEALQVKDPDNLCFVTQTTLSVDDTLDIIAALQSKFPSIEGPRKDDICYATQNRQDAVRSLATQARLFIVVGSKNSSNSNRLRELAEKSGAQAYLVDSAADVKAEWFAGVDKVAVTAGASAPEVLVKQVIDAITHLAPSVVTEVEGRKEDVVFAVPVELR
ncbi:4-hydroxy-3-methylbut-2-enyl diphosphate reductase [Shewanella litorisediminis]|uniref:4-hydroxy-3-methylbut-2-enyl diphosphate reductase n=1 Tax=Shewanella litorisediminis TaxID=1173586 RepID=A0ABX7G868_9GAMM|nr:4-hydroxy-3-methylbut-2-enyl diphosphate reductase [Shewanella litorisediminis]MCL2917544.1 4-hydroxy-3-methylbut-2-enyl diphosphate reductase [Shewanella litorisediminis]QRH03572.1 4-hydroxy-3-methylbut-2-enyl diphosphate reductase [Shewanella litorisediminis]